MTDSILRKLSRRPGDSILRRGVTARRTLDPTFRNSNNVRKNVATIAAELGGPYALWFADDYQRGQHGRLRDRSSRRRHHLTFGSTDGAEIIAAPGGGNALRLNGASGRYASTPDANALDIVGDLDIIVKASLDAWVGAAEQVLVSKLGSSVANQSYALVAHTGGGFRFYLGDGATTAAVTSAAHNLTAGSVKWVRVTYRTSDRRVQFFLSDDGSTWTQLGGDAIHAITAIGNGAAPLEVGSWFGGTAALTTGFVYRAIVKNGIDGTTVFDADFSTIKERVPFFAESTGKVVTINPFTSTRIANQAAWFSGTNGNQAGTPRSTAITNVGPDIELVAKIAILNSTVTGRIISLISSAVAASAWEIYSDGSAILFQVSNGAAFTNIGTGIPLSSLTPGRFVWVRATYQANSGAGQYAGTYYTAPDSDTEPTSWTQVGAVATGASITPNAAATVNELVIGNRNGADRPFIGAIARGIVRDGIAGTTVADFDTRGVIDGQKFWTGSIGNQWSVVTSAVDGADSNDPLFLSYTGEKYVYLPGIAGNYVSTPDHADVDFTGDIDFQVLVAPDDWTPGATTDFVSKYGAAGTRSFRFGIQASGNLFFQRSLDGTVDETDFTAATDGGAALSLGAIDGQWLWVRVTRNATTGEIKFFTGGSGETPVWVQFGVGQSGTPGAIFNSASLINIGGNTGGTANLLAGKVRRVILKNGIDGTVVADFDASSLSQTSMVDSTGKTWTVNRATSGRKTVVVDRPLFLFGTDDYLETADHADLDIAAGDAFTAILAMRAFGATAAHQVYFSKRETSVAGWELATTSGTQVGRFTFSDGAATGDTTGANARIGSVVSFAGRRSITADQAQVIVNGAEGGTTDNTTGTLANAVGLLIGARRTGGSVVNQGDFEFVGAAFFRRELTNAEIAEVSRYLVMGRAA